MIDYINEDKVTAFIIKQIKSEFKLLAFKLGDIDFSYYRLTGGSITKEENPLDAVYREILEETGIKESDLTYVRKVGELKYFKSLIHKEVNMHNFLFFCNDDERDSYDFKVTSQDKDNGLIFNYQWISPKQIDEIDPELSQFINSYNMPEFFLKPKEFGLEKGELSLAQTSPQWKRIYEFQELEIRKKISEKIKVHHVGSTSVTDFIAKPIIDILLEYDDKNEIQSIVKKLEEIGFNHFGEFGIVGRNYFTKGTKDRTYFHLHAFKSGAIEIHNHLKVAEVLNSNKEYKKEYFDYKAKNVNISRDDYTNNKGELMKKIMNS